MKVKYNYALKYLMQQKEFSMISKKICLSILASVFLVACNTNISQDIVKNYQDALNADLEKTFKEDFKQAGIDIDFKPFSCEASKELISCKSPKWSFHSTHQSFGVNIENIELKSSEYYDGKPIGLISYKEYYEKIFKKNNKGINELKFELSFDEAAGEQIKTKIAENISDEKLKAYLYEFTKDKFLVEMSQNHNKAKENILGEFIYKIANQRDTNIHWSMDYSFNTQLFDALDNNNIKFNTQSLTTDEAGLDALLNDEYYSYGMSEPLLKLIKEATKGVYFHNNILNIKLDTQSLFKEHIEELKTKLQGDVHPQFKAMFDKLLLVIDDATQNPLYELDLEIKFKDSIPLAEYTNSFFEAIEKVSLNKQDFTNESKHFAVLFLLGAGSMLGGF